MFGAFSIMKIEVYGNEVKPQIAESIIKKIKQRKGLENADDELVSEKIAEFLKKDSKALKRISSAEDFNSIARSKEVEAVIKHVRAELRHVYGLFIAENLEDLKEIISSGASEIRDILMRHVSSKERISFCEEFYRRIFDITGKPDSIIDIACGLNPLSFEFMDLPKKTRYYALELNQNDADAINEFFSRWGIDGKAFKHDITKKPIRYKADIAFAFKIFDIIDNKITERILKELDVKWIAASFSTKTVGKKDMMFRRRAGFQKMLRRLEMEYQTIEFPNEIVY
ncbi:hypothetical protein GF345_04705, partial [Candidatus Woesearchaeota archaeon]|nr:hypothetical protein [Candidatus Woesearchaeota archaeon]